jgi:hypothetical protein
LYLSGFCAYTQGNYPSAQAAYTMVQELALKNEPPTPCTPFARFRPLADQFARTPETALALPRTDAQWLAVLKTRPALVKLLPKARRTPEMLALANEGHRDGPRQAAQTPFSLGPSTHPADLVDSDANPERPQPRPQSNAWARFWDKLKRPAG